MVTVMNQRRFGCLAQRVVAVLGVTAAAALCGAETLNMPIAVGWGYNAQGQSTVPATAISIQQVIGGGNHTLALTRAGTVLAWGYNFQSQCAVPANLGTVREVSATTVHSAALLEDDSVRCWGDNSKGQCNVPEDLPPVLHLAGGNYHILAVLRNGGVRVWGDNSKGQHSVPTSVEGIVASGPTADHPIVLNASGSVFAWGSNVYGESTVPTNGLIATQVCGGGGFSLALRTDGTLVAWGRNNFGQCNIPNIQGGAVEISAGGDFGVALTSTGELVFWGRTAYGEAKVPTRLIGASGISAGGGHVVVIAEGDCDSDGILDSAAILENSAIDLNANGVPDPCDVFIGWEEDCDTNTVIDSYQQGVNLPYAVQSAQLGPIGHSSPQTADLFAPPFTLSDPVLAVTARGDFSLPSEFVTIYLNGRYVGQLFTDTGSDKNDCRSQITRQITLPRAFYNEAIHLGGGATAATFQFLPSIAVNANQCQTGSWIQCRLDYTAAITGDCNANGLLDVCEVRDYPETDANGNGVVDSCENYELVFLCPGDIDGDGEVGGGDISSLLVRFGMSMPGDPADLDQDGEVGASDISFLLTLFGPC
jgi:alpha-tubulin suppressor-like RCC1 family protein